MFHTFCETSVAQDILCDRARRREKKRGGWGWLVGEEERGRVIKEGQARLR